MKAGKMDRRVTLQRATLIDDGMTASAEQAWQDLGTVWASVTPVSDGEKWRAGATGGSISHRVLVRYSTVTASLKKSDRILLEGRVLDIGGVREVGRRETFEISATEAV